MKKYLQIAIDGPVASGTSTVARLLAREMRITYINTGAMYRALTLACLRAGTGNSKIDRVVDLLKKTTITVEPPASHNHHAFIVRLNGEDVTDLIHAPGVSRETPKVAAIPQVRRIMVARQQELAHHRSVVMEGRDIGLRVLPGADLKIYLTASVAVRARRRWLQHQVHGGQRTLEEEIEDVKRRDLQDTTRDIDPLQKLPDAWEIDTTHLTPQEVVAKIKAELKRRKLI
ncbi:MAG: (d)CMP kinase [Patescibacteria group bacterium]